MSKKREERLIVFRQNGSTQVSGLWLVFDEINNVPVAYVDNEERARLIAAGTAGLPPGLLFKISAMPHHVPGESHAITTRMQGHAERCMLYMWNNYVTSQWISVNERLPAETSPEQHYLGFDGKDVFFVTYQKFDGEPIWCSTFESDDPDAQITHWMPEPPKPNIQP